MTQLSNYKSKWVKFSGRSFSVFLILSFEIFSFFQAFRNRFSHFFIACFTCFFRPCKASRTKFLRCHFAIFLWQILDFPGLPQFFHALEVTTDAPITVATPWWEAASSTSVPETALSGDERVIFNQEQEREWNGPPRSRNRQPGADAAANRDDYGREDLQKYRSSWTEDSEGRQSTAQSRDDGYGGQSTPPAGRRTAGRTLNNHDMTTMQSIDYLNRYTPRPRPTERPNDAGVQQSVDEVAGRVNEWSRRGAAVLSGRTDGRRPTPPRYVFVRSGESLFLLVF